jgi:hypothetical protein
MSAKVWAQEEKQAGKSIPSTAPGKPAETQPAEGPVPKLEFSPTDFDFGEVWQGVPATREFTVKNSGTAPLTLSVEASCGCTAVVKPKSPLEPGESDKFSISYDSKRAGAAHKKVTLKTNDLSQPAAEIAVHGTVKPVFATTPADQLTFSGLETDSVATLTMKLECKYDHPLHLKLKAGEDYGRFEIALKEIKPGLEYELSASTKPPLQNGYNRAMVTLETGLELVPTLTIPVTANIQPPVLVIPFVLVIHPEQTEPKQHLIRVQYQKAQPLKITEVKSNLEPIRYELPQAPRPTQADTAYYELRVTLPPFADIPEEGAKLEIITDSQNPEYQRIEIPVVRAGKGVQKLISSSGSPPKPTPPAGQPSSRPGRDRSP